MFGVLSEHGLVDWHAPVTCLLIVLASPYGGEFARLMQELPESLKGEGKIGQKAMKNPSKVEERREKLAPAPLLGFPLNVESAKPVGAPSAPRSSVFLLKENLHPQMVRGCLGLGLRLALKHFKTYHHNSVRTGRQDLRARWPRPSPHLHASHALAVVFGVALGPLF